MSTHLARPQAQTIVRQMLDGTRFVFALPEVQGLRDEWHDAERRVAASLLRRLASALDGGRVARIEAAVQRHDPVGWPDGEGYGSDEGETA